MIRKSGYRFSERSCSNKKVEQDDDSKKSHPDLGEGRDVDPDLTAGPRLPHRHRCRRHLYQGRAHRQRDPEVVGRFSVLTTHVDPRGVAKGVVEVFRNVLEQSGVDPKQVIFLAHSTTQATNALLEGDVATVGVIGMSTRVESLLAKSQSAMKPIELAPGRHMKPANR